MKFWFRLTVSVVVLLVIGVVLPWPDIIAGFAALDFAVWALTVAVFLAAHLAGSAKWRMLVNLGRAHLSFRWAVRCYGAGLFANLCLPSIVGGDVVRAALAGKQTGRAEAVVWGSIADRLIDVFALGLLIGLGLALNRHLVPGVSANTTLFVLVVGAVVGLGTLWWAGSQPLRTWPTRFRRIIARSFVAIRRLRRAPGSATVALLVALSMQSVFVVVNAAIGRSIGIDVPTAVWFLVFPMAKLAGLVPVSLNGLGVRDAAQGALLVGLGVPAALGVVASLVWQSVLVADGLLAGFIAWQLGRRNGLSATTTPHMLSTTL